MRRWNQQRAAEKIKIIHRPCHTDYRVIYEPTGALTICFGACIRIDHDDIDFEYFNEDGKTGITTASIYGDGKIMFGEEEMPLSPGERVFNQHPLVQYPFPTRRSRHIPNTYSLNITM